MEQAREFGHNGLQEDSMQSHEFAYAYHDAPPGDVPKDGWKRAEIHEIAELYPLARQLEAEMKALEYPRKDSFAMGLVLREAVCNAVRHGNRGDSSRAAVISYQLGAEAVLVEVADEGLGFNPYLAPDLFAEPPRGERKAGRGLFLMRVYMSWIRFNKRG